jgi:hypothetical protein
MKTGAGCVGGGRPLDGHRIVRTPPRIEKRVRNERFHPNTLNKLARALGVEPTKLLGED